VGGVRRLALRWDGLPLAHSTIGEPPFLGVIIGDVAVAIMAAEAVAMPQLVEFPDDLVWVSQRSTALATALRFGMFDTIGAIELMVFLKES